MDSTGNPENKPLEYEETPIIEPVEAREVDTAIKKETTSSDQQKGKEPVAAGGLKRSLFRFIGTLVAVTALFIVGIGLSFVLRRYIPTGIPEKKPVTQEVQPVATPTKTETMVDPYGTWKSYQVMSGVTKQPISGIIFKLPADILAPICDGGRCASQGTYLPGGTRLTVAGRGSGQILSDFRGKSVSDLAGRVFEIKEASVAGHPALEFKGLFTGTTNGGYAFNQMRGFMIEVTDTLSLEMNHFTPSGVSADFAADDVLFDRILNTLSFEVPQGLQKGAVTLPTEAPTLAPASTMSATSPAANPD